MRISIIKQICIAWQFISSFWCIEPSIQRWRLYMYSCMYSDVGLNPTLKMFLKWLHCFFCFVLFFFGTYRNKVSIESFGVSVGLLSKPNIAHLSFLFMYGDVGLKPTYSNAGVFFFALAGRVLLRTFGVIVGLHANPTLNTVNSFSWLSKKVKHC